MAILGLCGGYVGARWAEYCGGGGAHTASFCRFFCRRGLTTWVHKECAPKVGRTAAREEDAGEKEAERRRAGRGRSLGV